jgi:hypothetical protein
VDAITHARDADAGGASYGLRAARVLRRVPGTRGVSDNADGGFAQVSAAAWIDSNGGFAILGDSRLCGRALLRAFDSVRFFRKSAGAHARQQVRSNQNTDQDTVQNTDRSIHRSPA